MLVMLAVLGTMGSFYAEYWEWRREVEAARAASAGLSDEDAAAAAQAAADATPVDASLVRSMRVGIRLAMGYFAAEPPEGMPDLLVRLTWPQ
jgi:hypothetical protein